MKKNILAVCVLSAVLLSSCGSDGSTSAGEVQTTAFVADKSETVSGISVNDTALITEETESTEPESSTETTAVETESTELDTETEAEKSVGETDEEIVNRIKSIDNSAYDQYSFIRKYTAEVGNLYIVSQIVEEETRSEWVDNVYLKKSDEERRALPTLYQAIVELGISEDDFRKENEKLREYPDMYYSDEIISALYLEDVNEMKRLLADPWALYYNGEVYAFDEMYADPNIVAGVPADVMNEYLDFIETIDEIKVRN